MNKNFTVVCITSDPYLWAIKPYAYLFDTFWNADKPEVFVAGFTPPDFRIPEYFRFLSIDAAPYPTNRWSDALIATLKSIDNDLVLLMLEDYWLCREPDTECIDMLAYFMKENPNVLKIDLTSSHIHRWDNAPEAEDLLSIGHYDIIKSPKLYPYRMSLQSALWNRERLLNILQPGLTPWQIEMYYGVPDEIVLGTRQLPLRYANIVLKGKVMDYEVVHIPEPYQSAVRKMIPGGWGVDVRTE